MSALAQNKKQNFLEGAAILTVSVAVIKVFGFIYKIPLGNLLGDTGMSYFYVAYNIYSVLLTVSTAGLPVALSKMISEAYTQNRPVMAKRIFKVALAAFIVLGSIGSLALFLFPTELALMMDREMVQASPSILAMSPAVLLVCILSAYRGYIQGHSNMTPTSVSQVIEVGGKVLFGLIASWVLMGRGRGLPEISAAAIAGVPVGSLAACIYIIAKKRASEKGMAKPLANPDIPDPRGKILAKLLKIGIPISLGSSILSIITLIDTMLTLNRLQLAAGISAEHTKELFGTYQMATPVSNLPAAFITSLTISIVPAISACIAVKKHGEAREITESSLRIATLLALPMCVGLLILSRPIMDVLYMGKITVEGPALLALLSASAYFICMTLMTNAALQAYGAEQLPIISMLTGGAVKIALNWVLVAKPDIHILGAPIGTLACYIVMCTLNCIFLSSKMREGLRLSRIIVRPAVSSAVMGLAAFSTYTPLSKLLSRGGELSRVPMAIAMMTAIAAAIAVYLAMIILTRAITRDDLLLIPKGEKIAAVLRLK